MLGGQRRSPVVFRRKKGPIAGHFSRYTRQLPARADWLAESIGFEPTVAVRCLHRATGVPSASVATRQAGTCLQKVASLRAFCAMRSRDHAANITVDAEPTAAERRGRKVRELSDWLPVETRKNWKMRFIALFCCNPGTIELYALISPTSFGGSRSIRHLGLAGGFF
jgi:hypothetical protein